MSCIPTSRMTLPVEAITSGSPVKKKITQFHHRTLALAYAANRLDHIYRTIKPHLEKGKNHIVISDRCYLSPLWSIRAETAFSF
ncbi:MAG: hypothetical protein R2788_12625 [Saprospiraceae bacterium]